MKGLARKITEHDAFDDVVLTLLVVNAAAMGLETSASAVELYGDYLSVFFVVSQIVFVAEIFLRVVAAENLRTFFKDPWNSFDAGVVAISLIPMIGSLALVARLARLLRMARLFSVSETMRSWVGRVGASLGLLARVGVALAVVIYGFGIAGHAAFSELDGERWGSLGRSMLTLVVLAFGEELRATVSAVAANAPLAVVFFAAYFFVLATLLFTTIAELVAARSPS